MGIFSSHKERLHLEKLDLAYKCYKPEFVGMLFPGGKQQANNIIVSFGKIYGLNINKCNAKTYYDILTTYTDIVTRKVVTKSSDELIISSLKVNHSNLIKDDITAKKALAFVSLNMKNSDFVIKSDDEMSMVNTLANYFSQSKVAIENNRANEYENLNDPEYGLVVTKPIFTHGIDGANKYLESLLTLEGNPLTWNRIGSSSSKDIYGLIDIYSGSLKTGKEYKRLYISIYGSTNSTHIPNGFMTHESVHANISNSSDDNNKKQQTTDNSIDDCDSSPFFDVFSLAYEHIRDHLKKTDFYNKNVRKEIIPFLITLSDYIALCNNADRDSLFDQAISWAETLLHSQNASQWITDRMDFYGSIIRNKRIRGEWLLSDIDEKNNTPVMRCIIAFGDIIVNPECIEDYYDAPINIPSPLSLLPFQKAMINEITKDVLQFTKSIQKLLTEQFGDNRKAVHNEYSDKPEFKKAYSIYGDKLETIIKYWSAFYILDKEIKSMEDASILKNARIAMMKKVEVDKGREFLDTIMNLKNVIDEEKFAAEIDIINAVNNDKTGKFKWD